jgi:hypothetical protein
MRWVLMVFLRMSALWYCHVGLYPTVCSGILFGASNVRPLRCFRRFVCACVCVSFSGAHQVGPFSRLAGHLNEVRRPAAECAVAIAFISQPVV